MNDEIITAGRHYINPAHVVSWEIYKAVPAGWDEEEGVRILPKPLQVEVVTTAIDSEYRDGGDYPDQRHVRINPYTISLYGEAASQFLRYWEIREY